MTDNKRLYSELDVVEYGKTLIAKGFIQDLMSLSSQDSDSKRFYSEPDVVEYDRLWKQMFYSEPDAIEYDKDSKLQPRLENLFGIPWNSAIIPISDLLDSGIFIGILFFWS